MPAPSTVPFWGTATGTEITTLTLTGVEYVGNYTAGDVVYSLLEYTASGSPDFIALGVLAGHWLTASGFSNSINNNTSIIHAVDNTSKTITIRLVGADADTNESGVSGSGVVNNAGAIITEPSDSKKAQGLINGEKPGAGHLNWLFRTICQWIVYFASGGAIVIRETLTSWLSIDRSDSDNGAEIVKGLGWVRFNPDANDAPGEGFYEPSVGDGLGELETPSVDSILAMLSAFLPEILPPVTASLNFASTAQHNISTATVGVPGAQVGDLVVLGPPSDIEAGFSWCGFVSDVDEVTIRLTKHTAGTVDPVEATWSVTVTRPNSMPVIMVRGLKIYTNMIGGAYANSAALEADLSISDNEAAFNLLVNSQQHRSTIRTDTAIKALVQGSATADAIMTATGGY